MACWVHDGNHPNGLAALLMHLRVSFWWARAVQGQSSNEDVEAWAPQVSKLIAIQLLALRQVIVSAEMKIRYLHKPRDAIHFCVRVLHAHLPCARRWNIRHAL